jgi:hypothetical protein
MCWCCCASPSVGAAVLVHACMHVLVLDGAGAGVGAAGCMVLVLKWQHRSPCKYLPCIKSFLVVRSMSKVLVLGDVCCVPPHKLLSPQCVLFHWLLHPLITKELPGWFINRS